jgi:hypothetical protein
LFSDEEFLYLMNNWDKELVQFKLHLEVNCTKFKMCHIELSPGWVFGYQGVGY